jgi:hypothetical protein
MASLLMVGGDLTLYTQLQASVAMLDQLGIRLNYVATEDWLAKLSRDRGRGAEATLINLASQPRGSTRLPKPRMAVPRPVTLDRSGRGTRTMKMSRWSTLKSSGSGDHERHFQAIGPAPAFTSWPGDDIPVGSRSGCTLDDLAARS